LLFRAAFLPLWREGVQPIAPEKMRSSGVHRSMRQIMLHRRNGMAPN
jgi:hypothetical protein